jgi:hypothetical protein
MNGNSFMEKNEFPFLGSEKDMPTENINKKNQLLKINCKKYLFLSDNEVDLSNENNNNSIAGAKKPKLDLKIGPSSVFLWKIHNLLKK